MEFLEINKMFGNLIPTASSTVLPKVRFSHPTKTARSAADYFKDEKNVKQWNNGNSTWVKIQPQIINTEIKT